MRSATSVIHEDARGLDAFSSSTSGGVHDRGWRYRLILGDSWTVDALSITWANWEGKG
jgi:hypothetical protein